MCTRYPIINRVSELKVHIELTRFVQPEKIEIDANERAVNEKSQYCFFVCTTFDSFLNDFKFDVQDYGGFIKSPVGNVYSDRFVLLSILSQINFLLYCVDQWIKDEIPTKLRLGYLLYFSLLNVNEQINTKLGITFKIDTSWKSDRFRNAMAHYKLGIVLKENELISGDAMFGLTRKLFGEDYLIVKKSIYKELKGLAKQIGEYLELPQRMVYLQ